MPSLKDMMEPAMYSAFERLLSKDSELFQSVVKATVDNHLSSSASSCSETVSATVASTSSNNSIVNKDNDDPASAAAINDE